MWIVPSWYEGIWVTKIEMHGQIYQKPYHLWYQYFSLISTPTYNNPHKCNWSTAIDVAGRYTSKPAIKPQIPLRHLEPNHISTIGLEMAFYYVLFIALFMASLFIVIRRRGRDHVHIPQNWLVVGMLPSLLLNVHRIHDWVTDALRGGSHSYLFKGPWLSGMVIPATCNPDDFHYICKTKASRFPRGSEFTERFDILGDGILNTSGDLWRNRRKIAHKLLHTKVSRLYGNGHEREGWEDASAYVEVLCPARKGGGLAGSAQ